MNPIDLSSRPGAGVPASTSLRGSFSPAGFLELLFERVSLEQLNALNARRHPAGRPVRRLTRGHGRAAFAKLQCAALVELVMHNPLAARLGWNGESEWKLASSLLDQLPERCLLMGDRLYGCGSFLAQASPTLQSRGSHFLVRVKQ